MHAPLVLSTGVHVRLKRKLHCYERINHNDNVANHNLALSWTRTRVAKLRKEALFLQSTPFLVATAADNPPALDSSPSPLPPSHVPAPSPLSPHPPSFLPFLPPPATHRVRDLGAGPLGVDLDVLLPVPLHGVHGLVGVLLVLDRHLGHVTHLAAVLLRRHADVTPLKRGPKQQEGELEQMGAGAFAESSRESA